MSEIQLTTEQAIAFERLTHDLLRGNRARRLAQLVYRMRQAQIAYFKTREKADLAKSKELEKQVDSELNAMKKRS